MKEHPILMNTEMVRATLEKRKTQTRRPITPQPVSGLDLTACRINTNPEERKVWPSVRYCKGDRLWVRETCFYCNGSESYVYKADNPDLKSQVGTIYPDKLKWCPSIHMPRIASRITLEVVDVRVERLQEITKEDALKEGAYEMPPYPFIGIRDGTALIGAFQRYWNSSYPKKPEYQWQANPFCWVIEFKR